MTKRQLFLLNVFFFGFFQIILVVLNFWQVPFAILGFLLTFCIHLYSLQTVFSIKKEKDKYIFLGLFYLSSFFFLVSFPNLDLFVKLVLCVFLSFLAYFNLLALNIFVVSKTLSESIPLSQPAQLVAMFMMVFTTFFASVFIYKLQFFENFGIVNMIVKGVLFFVFFIFLYVSTKWLFLPDSKEGGGYYLKSISYYYLQEFAIFVLTFLSGVLLLHPFENYARATLVATGIYSVNNIILKQISHRFGMKDLLNSFLFFLITYILVSFL